MNLRQNSANEIAHEECAQPPVMKYNVGLFQPHAGRVTYNTWDVKANIWIHKPVQLLVQLGVVLLVDNLPGLV